MKTLLVPALLGVCFLTALAFCPAGAQMPFTASPMPNANPYANRGFTQPNNNMPQVAPATAVPGGNGYGMPGNGYANPAFSTVPIDPDHKLTRGDIMTYRVVEDRDEPPVQLQVGASGEVNVPLINRVKAADKTVQQLSSEIKGRLEQEYYYHATVVLGLDSVAQRASRGTVYVSGAVMAQGSVELPLDTPMTVSQAIAKVGGFKDFADQRRVKLIRKNAPKKGIIVDVKDVQHGALDKDVAIQPDDQIFVPERSVIF